MRLALKGQNLLVWRYLTAKQKMISLRPQRLCGENVILAKHDVVIKGKLGG